jgi:hypothetical protein
MIRVLRAPVPPVRPLVGDLEFDPLHGGLVGILVQLPDLLVGEDEPVVPCPDRNPRALRRFAAPRLQGREAEDPPVRGRLLLPPDPVGILPYVLSPDGHTGVDLSPELLQVVICHGKFMDGTPLRMNDLNAYLNGEYSERLQEIQK